MSSVVLDASALLALLHREPGADVVEKHLPGACISAVNYSEVLKKAVEKRGTLADASAVVRALQLDIVPFDDASAAAAAGLAPRTQVKGLSFADRACLALGIETHRRVLTADGRWSELELPVTVVQIREGAAKRSVKK